MRNSSKPGWRRLWFASLGAALAGISAPGRAAPPIPSTPSGLRSNARLQPELERPLDALAHLPDDVPITVLIPKPERLFRKLEAQWARAAASSSGLAHRAFWSGIAEVIGGPVEPATFRRLGVAVDRDVALLLDPAAGVTIVRFGLDDRRRFEAWLARTVPEDRRSMDLGRERAIVLYPDSDLPIICLLRVRHAHCQIGEGQGARPGAALQQLMSESIRPLVEAADLAAVRPHIQNDAELLAFLRPRLLAPGLAAWMGDRARRAHRFGPPEEQRRVLERHAERARVLRGWVDDGRLVALSLAIDRGRVRGRAHAVLEPRAAERLASLVSARPPGPDVVAWSHTPALARFFSRLEPEAASAFFALLGLDLPASVLDGNFAALLLGIDAECKAAKSAGQDPRARLFYLPLAAAVGLRAPVDAKRMILERQEGAPLALFSGVRFETDPDQRTLRAEHLGSPLEVRVLDRVALMGTGHGAAAAAERRWSATVEPRVGPVGFLEASVDLAAVRAALSGARLEGASNRDLKHLQAAERRLDIWLGDMRRLHLGAHLATRAPQLTVELDGQ